MLSLSALVFVFGFGFAAGVIWRDRYQAAGIR
jgi:hypothetical protein